MRGRQAPVIAGRATPEGTERYLRRFADRCAPDHFRRIAGLTLSSIGIGTYLGSPADKDDEAYRDAVVSAVRSGCNVIDTAINYRFQRSERSVGAALRILHEEGFGREEIVVATKGGFIPFDGGIPSDPAGWFRSALIEPGIAVPDDVVADCHIMTPGYLESQIEWSRANLGLESIDIYYIHNPETQLQQVARPEFLMRIKAAFEMLEEKVREGIIGRYGVATWDGFRSPPENPGHLSLEELLSVAARSSGGTDTAFGVVQLPVNLMMSEASLSPTQRIRGRRVSLLDAAMAEELIVMASGSLLQGQIIRALGPEFGEFIPGARTSAQRGIQVVRSTPGLATALVGMKTTAHVEENLELATLARMPAETAIALLRAVRTPPSPS